MQFQLPKKPPPQHLIANVNIVPRTSEGWLLIRLQDGFWEIPGGTLEPGESYLDTIEREVGKIRVVEVNDRYSRAELVDGDRIRRGDFVHL